MNHFALAHAFKLCVNEKRVTKVNQTSNEQTTTGLRCDTHAVENRPFFTAQDGNLVLYRNNRTLPSQLLLGLYLCITAERRHTTEIAGKAVSLQSQLFNASE